MSHTASVNVASCDRRGRINVASKSTLARTCARTRNVESGDRAVKGAQETVKYTDRIVVVTGTHACRVNAEGSGALPGSCARTWRIERGDSAVWSAQNCVNRTARVGV